MTQPPAVAALGAPKAHTGAMGGRDLRPAMTFFWG